MNSVKLILNSEKLEEQLANWASTTPTPFVDPMMSRLRIEEDEHTATATQHTTKLASANQANTTMESQMQTLLIQVQALQLANTPNHRKNYGHGRGRGRGRGLGRGRGCGRGAGRGRKRARPHALPIPKYCWTHGNC